MRFFRQALLFLPFLYCLSGCATIRLDDTASDIVKAHVVQFDREGIAVDPSREDVPRLESAYGNYLDSIFDSLRRSGHRKVIILIHGGMANQRDKISRAIHYSRLMNEEGYFPIFVNWESSLLQSYATHLFHLRQGEYIDAWYAAPFVLASDLARSGGRAPLVWGTVLKNGVEANRFGKSTLQR